MPQGHAGCPRAQELGSLRPVLHTLGPVLGSGSLTVSPGGSSPIQHVSSQEEKAVFNLQFYFYRQQMAEPGTFSCLELIFAKA